MIRGSIRGARQGNSLFPDTLIQAPVLTGSAIQWMPGDRSLTVKLTSHFQLGRILRINEAVPPLPKSLHGMYRENFTFDCSISH